MIAEPGHRLYSQGRTPAQETSPVITASTTDTTIRIEGVLHLVEDTGLLL
jgi:hypothetical protein